MGQFFQALMDVLNMNKLLIQQYNADAKNSLLLHWARKCIITTSKNTDNQDVISVRKQSSSPVRPSWWNKKSLEEKYLAVKKSFY